MNFIAKTFELGPTPRSATSSARGLGSVRVMPSVADNCCAALAFGPRAAAATASRGRTPPARGWNAIGNAVAADRAARRAAPGCPLLRKTGAPKQALQAASLLVFLLCPAPRL